MSRYVYADNAATTPVSEAVFRAMEPWLRGGYGNPSSIYSIGREAHEAVEHARAQVAAVIGASPSEIVFTGCGSEADNFAVKGIASAQRNRGRHIISTKIEHHAMLHTFDYLKKLGFEITLLDVDSDGLVSPADVEAAIRPDTILISVMAANNEIGTIEPLAEIGAVAAAHKIPFHTDAVQAYGHIPIDVREMNISLLSLSGHKLYGPKGIGALYIKNGVRIDTFLHGGGQERGRRGGTENVAGIVGLGVAAEAAAASMAEESARIAAMRDRLIAELLKIPYSRLNGHPTRRLPGNASFCFEAIEGESLVLTLDMLGVAASSGSACSSGSLDPSHVLMAIGLPHEVAHGSLRLSLGAENTEEDVDRIVDAVRASVSRLRDMSPMWEDMMKQQSPGK
ncbi:MAG: cysteine desulfurase NifS [Clostridiaceae bacterium]|nr:cysteine desulfurase NifS [Clostridiaceae bacterium]MDY3285526.1 cysteine desulfurase NifS [Eubacteriales bacterium]